MSTVDTQAHGVESEIERTFQHSVGQALRSRVQRFDKLIVVVEKIKVAGLHLKLARRSGAAREWAPA
jgi:hypothetical protein